MAVRTEFTKPVSLAGIGCTLFVSCGPWDDYLEIEFPEAMSPDTTVLDRLRRIPHDTAMRSMDIRVREGPPPSIGMLVLYLGADEQRSRPHMERVGSVVLELAGAVPAFDFGDLLPSTVPEHRVISASLCDANAEPDAPRAGSREASVLSSPASASDGAPAPLVPETEPKRPEAASVGGAPQPPLPRVFLDRRMGFPTDEALKQAREDASRGLVRKALHLVDQVVERDRHSIAALELQQELRLLEDRDNRRRRAPWDAQALMEAGFSYLSLNANSQAADLLSRAVSLRPDKFMANCLLGIAMHRQGQHKAALHAYQRAILLRPGDPIPLGLMAALSRGEPPPPLEEERPIADLHSPVRSAKRSRLIANRH